MGARGKKSAADIAIVRSDVTEIPRQPPPDELTTEQANEWLAVVNRMPADWFPRETWGLLTQYCRHIVSARRVAQLIVGAEEDDSFDVNEYDRLLKMQEREGRAISSLATRMRISQQSLIHNEKKKPASIKPPWEKQ